MRTFPRFLVCAACGRHGRIEYEGGCSPDVCSQELAQWHLVAILADGRVPFESAEDLYYQIESSKLPLLDAQVDEAFASVVDHWNDVRDPREPSDLHLRYYH